MCRKLSKALYIDEIDKIAKKDENPSITRDVSVKACSRPLLKILDRHGGQRAAQGGRQASPPGIYARGYDEHSVICGGRLSAGEDY